MGWSLIQPNKSRFILDLFFLDPTSFIKMFCIGIAISHRTSVNRFHYTASLWYHNTDRREIMNAIAKRKLSTIKELAIFSKYSFVV